MLLSCQMNELLIQKLEWGIKSHGAMLGHVECKTVLIMLRKLNEWEELGSPTLELISELYREIEQLKEGEKPTQLFVNDETCNN